MKRSVIAFNTPAVHNCHGWKLSEYLAMGKAILSTPISHVLPKPLEHGRNVHIVRNEEEMREGVMQLLTDRSYRERLSEGAREYYRAYASPAASIRLILDSPAYQAVQ
jgi:glycosyltransferase involved in cell wall biosynthesis